MACARRTAHRRGNGSVRLIEPDFAGRLNGLTLLFEAFILMPARQMPLAAMARVVGESPHRVLLAVCKKCGKWFVAWLTTRM